MDDQAVVRQVAGKMLRQAGYDVCLVANGETAITAYRETLDCGQPFDAVILDLTVFGGMGGRDAAAALLAIDPNAKLLVSSGYSEDGVMSDYANHGFKAVLPKPYNSFQLINALAQVIDT
jgi:CheY-like chemotaxis protein